jgi:hypothetical protein
MRFLLVMLGLIEIVRGDVDGGKDSVVVVSCHRDTFMPNCSNP